MRQEELHGDIKFLCDRSLPHSTQDVLQATVLTGGPHCNGLPLESLQCILGLLDAFRELLVETSGISKRQQLTVSWHCHGANSDALEVRELSGDAPTSTETFHK